MRLDRNIRTFLSSNIRSLTASGLLFENETGKLEYVEFDDCYQHWLEWEVQHLDRYSPPMTEAQFVELTKEFKEVGSRNALDEPPFMIFYTQPQVKFEFSSYEEISGFRQKMYQLGGWNTYDLA